MTKDVLKNGRRISPRNPKTGTEVSTSRVVVFKASAILKQRINRHGPVTMRDRFASRH
jgi:integration host factor subunit alpha